MIRVQALCKSNNATFDLIDTFDPETLTGVQLLAKCPVELKDALYRIEEQAATTRPHFTNIKAIDLNFGCPSQEIINEGNEINTCKVLSD